MLMRSSTTCVEVELGPEPIQPVEAILMQRPEIFQQSLIQVGISTMGNATLQVERLKIMVIFIR